MRTKPGSDLPHFLCVPPLGALAHLVHQGLDQLPALLETRTDGLHQLLQNRVQVGLHRLGTQLLCGPRHHGCRKNNQRKSLTEVKLEDLVVPPEVLKDASTLIQYPTSHRVSSSTVLWHQSDDLTSNFLLQLPPGLEDLVHVGVDLDLLLPGRDATLLLQQRQPLQQVLLSQDVGRLHRLSARRKVSTNEPPAPVISHSISNNVAVGKVTDRKPNSLLLCLLGFEARQQIFLQRRQQLLHHQVSHHLPTQPSIFI